MYRGEEDNATMRPILEQEESVEPVLDDSIGRYAVVVV